MKTWIWVALAVVVIGGSTYWWVSQGNPNGYSFNSNATSNTNVKTIQISGYKISVQVPQDWNRGQEYENYGNIGVVGISSPVIKDYYDESCDAAAGCPKYSFGISATTKWPHDPAVYTAGTETLVDGTSQTFHSTLALPNGSSQRVKNEIATKVKNMTIGGADAVLVNSHTAPDVATEPFNQDVIWIRKGNMNWYIYPDNYTTNASVYDPIFETIKLTE
jgi:hypothetical protein